MYAYRHRIVIKGKLGTGMADTGINLIEKTGHNNSNQKSAEALGQLSDKTNVIQQLRELHLAVIRTKKLSLKSLMN